GSLVVSVSVTLAAAISAAVGVYFAFNAEAPGLNAPAPPVHVPLEAPPPRTPASCTCGLLAHTRWSAPAFTMAAGLMVIVIASLTAGHGPAGSLVASVSVTVPAAISAAEGMYEAFRSD